MTLWHLSWGEIRRRPGRTALTLAGIAIGVASIVAIGIATRTTRQAYQDMFESLTGRAALEVVGQALAPFDPQTARQLETVPGLAAAVGVVQTSSALVGRSGPRIVFVLGIDPQRDGLVRDYNLAAGRMVAAGDEVLVEEGFARQEGLDLGGVVRLVTPRGRRELSLVGLLAPRGAAASRKGAVVFMPLATAQRLFGLDDQINCLALVLDDDAQPAAVGAEVERRLGPGLAVQTPAERGDLAQDSLLSTEQALDVLSVVSLVAGAFVILNAFLMNLGERRKQFAILRALGATRRQITRLLAAEAALLGAVGTCLGIALGVAGAVIFVRGLEGLMGVPIAALAWDWQPFAAAAVIGPGVALAATYVPARQHARHPPLEGLLDRHNLRDARERRGVVLAGLAALSAAWLLSAALIGQVFSAPTTTALLPPTMGLFLVGGVLALPGLIGPLLRVAEWLLVPLAGVEGRLALRQLARHRPRTSLTVGVLVIAMVVTIGMGNSLINNVHDIGQWQAQALAVDFLVRSVMPDTGIMLAARLPDALPDELAAVEGVARVDRVAFVPARTDGGRQLLVIAKQMRPGDPVSLELASGDRGRVVDQMLSGEAVIGTVLANALGLGVGDRLTLRTPQGPLPLRIAGTSDEYTAGGAIAYLEWETARRLLGVSGADALTVQARRDGPAALDACEARLRRFCDERNLMLQTQADFSRFLDQLVGSVTGFLWMLMALVFVVASLGIVNTLTMNVLEQTRELGVLRAVALTRRQVRKLILAQAAAVALMSLVPGVAIGAALASIMNLATPAVSGHTVEFRLHFGFIAQTVLAAALIALVAALVPARRAARLSIVRALQYE